MPKIMTEDAPSFFRQLKNDRLEIVLKAPGFYLRASAPRDAIYELIETFEEQAGVSVDGLEERPRRKPKQIEGQMTIDMTDYGASPED